MQNMPTLFRVRLCSSAAYCSHLCEVLFDCTVVNINRLWAVRKEFEAIVMLDIDCVPLKRDLDIINRQVEI